ncbi:MAG: 30S ribosomal protein S1 [Acidimicrobiia bacterium]|nr:30S ribosomal protein S1 [Acidimicrobiia bacterium]
MSTDNDTASNPDEVTPEPQAIDAEAVHSEVPVLPDSETTPEPAEEVESPSAESSVVADEVPAVPEASEESLEPVQPEVSEDPAAEEPAAVTAIAEAEAVVPLVEVADEVVEEPIYDGPPAIVPTRISDLPDSIADDFEAAIEHTMLEFKEGDIVEGVVVAIENDEVLVDIGYKSEGVIPLSELSIRKAVDPLSVVQIGETLEALVLDKEDEEGRLILSKKRAQYERAWGKIQRITNAGGTVTGPVIEVVKGGLIVDIGLRGFLPASLVELRRVRDLDPYVGEQIEAKVIELDRNRNNVVLSRRAWLEEAQAEQRQAFLDDLKVGDARPGVVSSVVNFGAFVDLGGMDGLVHVSELSYQHVNHPSEVVKVGDEVQVRVLEVDRERERISLSIKQTMEDPWESFARQFSVGDNVSGVVTKTVPFGAFVSVGEGVEGLVHVSEIAMHRVESPELELSLGQPVEVKVTEMDNQRRRVSLSIKQALPGYQERPAAEPAAPRRRPPERHEFERETESAEETESAFNVDSSLEAILQELKERGIGRR